jgi:hypothetical protein
MFEKLPTHTGTCYISHLHPNCTKTREANSKKKLRKVEQRDVTACLLLATCMAMHGEHVWIKKTKQKVVVDKAKPTPLRRERVESFFCSFAFF